MTPLLLLAQEAVPTPVGDAEPSSGIAFWLVSLAVLSLAPFLLTVVTSFAKLVIVGGLLRQALGLQNTPPNSVITGLALLLTFTVMWPFVEDGVRAYRQLSAQSVATGEAAADPDRAFASNLLAATQPNMHAFLERHASARYVAFFDGLGEARRDAHVPAPVPGLDPASPAADDETLSEIAGGMLGLDPALLDAARRDLTVYAPAFLLTELTEAFQIGFLLFVPFLVIDLFVANVLLAMGMHMMQPTPISLPLKLLLFVVVSGWELIFRGLMLSYM